MDITLKEMVLDTERITEAAEKGFAKEDLLTFEKINPVSYRYYMPIPYKDHVDYSNKTKRFYSNYWTVVAYKANLFTNCAVTLVYMWISCLAVFSVATIIISNQSYRIYKKRVEFERYRRETTNALAHDLKTPLSIISGYAQNLIENVHTEKRDYYANNIYENVNRMDDILKSMLELSRYEADMIQINNKVFALRDVCNDLIARYRSLCDEKNITVSVEGDGNINADPSLIDRVVDNFMVNAIEHTQEGGDIKLTINPDSFEIYNSQSHIPDNMINVIWLPYKKADSSRSNTGGSGLGLSIAAKILDLYKFTYSAQNVDDGVKFSFKW